MSQDLIIGVDAGTSVIKAVAFDLDGNELAATGRTNVYVDLPGGGAEQDMARTWDDTAAVLRDLALHVPDLARRAAALAITGQGDGTWLIDREGEPVAPGLAVARTRVRPEIVRELDRSGVRDLVYRYTGCALNACNQSAHLIWLKRHAPQSARREPPPRFIARTGSTTSSPTSAAPTSPRASSPSANFRTRAYVPELLEAFGLADEAHLLPEMVEGSRATHPLTAAAAAATGLPEGLPVVLGYLDVLSAGLGGGIYEPGRAIGCSIVGSTGMHMRFVADAAGLQLGPEPTGYTMPFPVPGSVTQMQSNMAATLNIDWVVDRAREAAELLGHPFDRKTTLATLDARVLEARPAAAIYHPYIHEAGERGPFVDVNARAQFIGLSMRTSFLDLVRAVYEGLAFAARDCYGAMGHVPEEIRLAGGASRSKSFKTILASALATPVRDSPRQEAGAAGAAMMAAVAIGVFPDLGAATEDDG